MISIKNVTKTFANNSQSFTVLNNISLDIPEGIIYGVIGYSGAGKSTLIRLFNGLEKPSSGDVLIDDNSIVNVSNDQLREQQKQIGMVFQQFNLLSSKTVLENVTLPLKLNGESKTKRNQKALEMLEIVGLSDQVDKYPSQLSGGQKQRVAIARALVRDPKILLCDEATSALDPEATSSILDLLIKINQEFKITIIMVTHEMEAIRRICQQIAVLDSGEIVETGSVSQIFENPQSEITKSLITKSQVNNDFDSPELLQEIKDNGGADSLILKLSFPNKSADKPVITELIREYTDIEVSVLGGQLQPTIEGVLGHLIIQIKAPQKEHNEVIKSITDKSVQVEVL
ncbi:methionine ABC transporter ATP-binding protein [Lactobacillus sp. YT155]|uniref:methionine ABC transporter ATP-binding protein n=1 Tax=Lactobacillus sp. YT155 TaxID=3060955 RepID=UPI00265D9378|nr:methionine ABC transporter ATP-binding protein [Lactobacillus sp. YT155]MDO1605702.1 methionine ABC transporter ATP-binding protein [Lactobacillus sp. YT155]